MTSLRSIASPLVRPNSGYSAIDLPSLVRIWTRWLWRSATTSRPCESNSSACGVRNSPGPVPVLPMTAQELSGAVEHRDAADQVGIRDVGVALGHVDVAVGRIGDDVGRLGQRLRRIAPHARLAERQQHLAVRAELHDGAALVPSPEISSGPRRWRRPSRPPTRCRRDRRGCRAATRTSRRRSSGSPCPTRRSGGRGWPWCRDSPASCQASSGQPPTPIGHRGRWRRRWSRPTAAPPHRAAPSPG